MTPSVQRSALLSTAPPNHFSCQSLAGNWGAVGRGIGRYERGVFPSEYACGRRAVRLTGRGVRAPKSGASLSVWVAAQNPNAAWHEPVGTPVEKGTQQADTDEVAQIIGWLAALAVVPFIVHKYRRGWARLSDVGEFYVLMGVLFWGVSAAHRRALELPSLSLLVLTLSATVLYWSAFHSPGRTAWLEPGANRLPTKLERRLIRLMPSMAWALAFEAVAVALTVWLRHIVSLLFPVSVALFLLTFCLYVVAARGWRQAGRFL